MEADEIERALVKRKRRRLLEAAAKSRHELADPRGGMGRPWGLRDEVVSVEHAAEQLGLHPKTILRFIREGRLRATRPGKSYRILKQDLQAFAGLPAPPPASVGEPTVTCIVDIPGVTPELAQTWARAIPAALNTRVSDRPAVRAEIIHDPDRAHLKIVLVSSPEVVGGLLKLVQVLLERWGR
jgi:excisionase family DNA binding protein